MFRENKRRRKKERASTVSLCPKMHCTVIVDEKGRVMTAVSDNNHWLYV